MKKRLLLLSILAVIFSYNTKAQTFKIISTAVFSDSLQTQQKPLLLDVRTPAEFSEGHIRKALNIDLKSESFKTEVDQLDKNKTYYVYCRSGKRSALAVEQMRVLGFKTIYELDGGMLKWVSEGMQTVKEVVK